MNKKLKIVITIIALCVGLIFIGTKAYATTGKAINNTTILRKKASTNSEVVELISKGEEVEILEKEGEWYKVKYRSGKDTFVGYIRNDLLELEGEIKEEEQEQTSEELSSEDENSSKEVATEVEIKENDKIQLKNDVEIQLLPIIYSCKIEKISANTQITIAEVVGNWCHIEAESKEGWVLTSKIMVQGTKEEEKKEEEKKEEEKTEEKVEDKKEEKKEEDSTENRETKLYVSTSTLNLREKADTSSKIITQLNQNDEVIVIKVVDDTWTQVKVNGYEGYTASEYLSNKKTTTTSRGAQEIRNSEEEDAAKKKAEEDAAAKKKAEEEAAAKKKAEEEAAAKKKAEEEAAAKKKAEEKAAAKKKAEADTIANKAVKSTTTSSSSSSKVMGADIVAYAKKFLGYKYVLGTAGPNTFDCSGFTSYVYKHFGYTLSRTSTDQRKNGKEVKKSDLQPGDIVCFSGKEYNHVGIYIGGNQFIHAANSKKGIIITSLSDSYYVKNYITARRIL